jgi:5'-3' exonuclease
MNPIFVFVDGSYYNFYRYYALTNWWKSAYPEEPLDDPIKNEKFVEKFKKTFVSNLKEIPKKLKIGKDERPILIAGKDCKREDIWRTEICLNSELFKGEYKGNRKNDVEDGFMGGPLFKMAYEEKLFEAGGIKAILHHDKLEADDCIAISVKYILEKYPQSKIYIITSDKDYLQLAEERVELYNLGFKKLTDQKSSSGDSKRDLFCKIVMGDPSDNIASVFPKCGPKTALKYFENKESIEIRLNSSEVFK